MTRELDKSSVHFWRVNDVIRHISTGHPFLVIDIRKYVSTSIVDLEDNRHLRPILALLPAHYDEYAVDWQMIEKKAEINSENGSDNGIIKLEFKPWIS